MSLFGALSSAVNSLQLVQSSLQNTSQNINNVNNANATTHILSITTNGTGGGQIAQYSRVVDQALQGQMFSATSENSMAQTLSSYMKQLNDALGTTASGSSTDTATPTLSKAIQNFNTAMQTLSASPTSPVAQSQVLQMAQALVGAVKSVSAQVTTLQTQAQGDITTQVNQVNTDLSNIDALNNTISRLQSQDQPTADLEDQRDGYLKDLAGLVNIKTVERSDGSVSIFTTSGATLLDGAASPISFDGHQTITGAGGANITGAITGGSLGGLVNMVATPPANQPTSDQTYGVFSRMQTQLQAFTSALTGATASGQPSSLADAYNNATPVQDGELESGFFVGSTTGDLAVNPDLLSGKSAIKQSAITPMLNALTATGRTFNAAGVQLVNTSYAGMLDGIASNWSTVQNQLTTQASTTSGFLSNLQTRYSNETGVNLDVEVANLQVLQRNYSASAKIITTTNTMFTALENMA